MIMKGSSPKGLKTLWRKEKLLVTNNFSFSLSVFKRLLVKTRKNQGLFGKRLNNICILSKNENLTLQIFATKFSILDIRQLVFFALRPQNIWIFVEILKNSLW